MKKVLIFSIILIGNFGFAQQNSNNVFDNSESNTQQNDVQYSTNSEPTGPGDPVPVDNYIPLLIISGIVLTVYATKKKKVLS